MVKEESEATKLAKRMNLNYVGWGKYANKKGEIVAVSRGGKLYKYYTKKRRSDLISKDIEKREKSIDDIKRSKIASEPSTSSNILRKNIDDKVWQIRANAAGNISAPIDVIEKGSRDKESYVRLKALSNPNAPEKLLLKGIYDESTIVRYHIANNPNASDIVLKKLASDTAVSVRSSVMRHPHTPIDVLKIGLKDINPDVREEAEKSLLKKKSSKK